MECTAWRMITQEAGGSIINLFSAASDMAASTVTGAVICVDGGFTAMTIWTAPGAVPGIIYQGALCHKTPLE